MFLNNELWFLLYTTPQILHCPKLKITQDDGVSLLLCAQKVRFVHCLQKAAMTQVMSSAVANC
jgi:hypothetical protein